MIQRIQSVYLLLGALAMGALFFFEPMWSGEAARMFGWFTPVAAALAALTAAGALGTIFLHQNRRRQRAVVAGLQVMAAFTVVVLFAGFYGAGALNLRTESGALDVNTLIFLVLPVVAYLFFFLARRAVQSDIELVQSMDRLR